MPTASTHLAIQTTLFILAALFHIARSLLDLLPGRRRVVSRASTFWATIGLFFYAATFALGRYRDESSGAVISAGFMAPAALWAFKVSVTSLYPQLGLRLLVVGVLGVYLAASFLSAVLIQLFVCRPWREWDDEYCGDTAEVAAYSALNVSSYIIVMAIPVFIWRTLTQKRPVAMLLVLSSGVVIISIIHAVITLEIVSPANAKLLPEILVDTELALALILTTIPSLYLHIRYRKTPPPTTAVGTTDLEAELPPLPVSPGEERELVTLGLGFDPRHLGVLPDSIHEGSFRSSGESTDASRDAFRTDIVAGYAVRKHNEVQSREEVWEGDGNMPASPRSMGGS